MNNWITSILIGVIIVFTSYYSNGQEYRSIHQQQLEHYNALGHSADDYYDINQPAPVSHEKISRQCNLEKIVFGWHPYWSNGLETNYDWSLLSDLSYFSFEVDPATGNPSTTHGWLTSPVVDEALANGLRVNLCVTLFSDHATLFGNSAAQQNLIDTLISLVQLRGAHGVNIDFEGVSTSLKPGYTAFLIDLCTQMHAEIPNSQVSVCTYAVDWGDLFDEAAIDPYIDFYTIMGYAYYYSGSEVAGPTAPLYTFNTFNYNLARTVNFYLSQGASKEKLVLGLPYYGHEWTTENSTIPSNALSSVGSKTYKLVKNNTSGNYSNPQWEPTSFTPYYVFNDGTDWHQCFCDDENSLAYRYDFVNMMGIAGIGIWALGYDDGYTALWNLLRDKFTDCGTVPCSGTFYDMGGPDGVYYNNADYTFTIAPAGATQVSLEFLSFDIEAGSGTECDYDYIEIFDGPDASAESLGRFCNTTGNPGIITSSGNSLTIHFHSDGATVNDGFEAVWDCVLDTEPPVTSVFADDWQAGDFTAYFSDSDNDTVKHRFYQVLDFDGNEWRANGVYGYFNDNFQEQIHADWTNIGGVWAIENEHLVQTDESSSNTNLYASVEQEAGNVYLYHFKMNIDGSGTNRRAGMHFFCSDPEQSGRENSYMVYLRADQNTVQIYKYIDNDYNTGWYTTSDATVNTNQWYDVKILLDTESGEIQVFRDGVLVASATDDDPLMSGTAVSLRTGNCNVQYDDVKVYKSRADTAVVLAGDNQEVRYQNVDEFSPACRIKSIITDGSGNFSNLEGTDVNIDWTPPANPGAVNDGPGMDIDTTYTGTELSANWTLAEDANSFVERYEYCIGLSPGADDVVGWSNNGFDNTMTHTGLNLIQESNYYISVRAVNASGLTSVSHTSSDGVMYIDPGAFTVADFTVENTEICEGDAVEFINLSHNADSCLWLITGQQDTSSTDISPSLDLPAGMYNVKLIAYSQQYQNDTATQQISIQTMALPEADFAALDTVVELPSAIAYFVNNSINASSFHWDFGDSTEAYYAEPWHEYQNEGNYTVSLIAHSEFCGSDTITKVNFIHVIDPEGIDDVRIESINVYPNPAASNVHVSSDYHRISKVNIYNSAGKLCLSENCNAKRANINIRPLINGHYMMEVFTGRGKILKQLIIAR